MISTPIDLKYEVRFTNKFKKSYKKIKKQGKDISKLKNVVLKLASAHVLEEKYKNHKLADDRYFNNCYECHIEPDWLLVYTIIQDELILILTDTGSHSELFKK